MAIEYLVFDTEAEAQTRQTALGGSMGYPIVDGISAHSHGIIAHPSSGKYALKILPCCSTSDADEGLQNKEVDPVADELLTAEEIAALKDVATMTTDGWFPTEE